MSPRPVSTATCSIALLLSVIAVACSSDGGDAGSSSDPGASRTTAPPAVTPVETPNPAPSPTEPPLPETPPETRGRSAADCVSGWTTPPEGAERYLSPLGVIRRTTGVRGPLEVVDLRYFEGPESPPSEKGYLLVVQRWYVKLYARRDFSFAGRFLVEARRFGQGVAAVAPYGTGGYASPDWVGFQVEADPTPRAYEGLPGEWAGTPYDFVQGETGEDGLTIAGLPEEVVGCLEGT